MHHIARNRSAAAVGLAVATIAAATLLFGSLGSADPSTPGGALAAFGAVTDNNSGTTYNFGLRANEDAVQAGVGSVVLGLGGPALSLCTAHSTAPLAVDFTTTPETGSFPYQNVQCGRAFGQTVAIDGCVATIKAHGFVHSDDPNSNILDGMTVAVRFQKTGTSSANFDATISTVAKKIDVHGKATTGGPILMPTCS
jgi:hypothetical protein